MNGAFMANDRLTLWEGKSGQIPSLPIHDFAAMFVNDCNSISAQVFRLMDSEGSSFHSGLTPLPYAHVPARCPATMPAGEIIAWTPVRMVVAIGAWLMEETQLPAPVAVNAPKRRA